VDKKLIREELVEMKNRIKWLEDRAMKPQVGPTEPVDETLSTPTSSQRHQRVFLQPLQQDPTNIMIPSLHPILSQQSVWETWNRSGNKQLHQTITSVNDDIDYDPHAYEDTQNRHDGEKGGQLNRDYNDSHNNADNVESYTPEMSSEEDDLATILDQPPAKSKRGDIMDDNSEVASTVTKIDMMGDLIVMHEDVTTVNVEEPHTGEEDIFAKKELLANDTHLYDGKHVTIRVARNDDMHRDVDNKHMTTLKRPEAYEAARKIDMITKTNLKEMKDEMDRRRTEILADNTYLQATIETYQEEDVDKTNPETNMENISIVRMSTNMLPETANFGAKGLHARETVEDPIVKEELPADNKVADKYEYEKELLTKYEYSHCGNVMTSQTETADVTKILAYMDENYNIPSQKGDEDEPTADLERKKSNVRVNPYSINKTYQEEDVANNEQTNSVANKKESRGSP
jgi:predicted RNA-binding protein